MGISNKNIRQVRFNVDDLPEFLRKLRETGKKHNTVIICLNRNLIAGKQHVISAVLHAQRSFETGQNIARSIEIETLLYAGGTRQTGAVGEFGVLKGKNEAYICVVSESKSVFDELSSFMEFFDEEDWEFISQEKQKKLMEVFCITPEEIEVTGIEKFKALVNERVALLEVNK